MINILSINNSLHSSSACLIYKNTCYAIEQERVSRRRHAVLENVSAETISKLLSIMESPDVVTHVLSTGSIGFEVDNNTFPRKISPNVVTDLCKDHHHHHHHMHTAFYASRFQECMHIVADGKGDMQDSVTLGLQDLNKGITILKKYSEIYSLGALYTACCNVAGIKDHGEGQFMGLSSFGRPLYVQDMPFNFNVETGEFESKIDLGNTQYSATDAMFSYLCKTIYPHKPLENSIMEKDPCSIMLYADLACSVQTWLNTTIVNLAKYLKLLDTGNCENLCISGGVTLNCVANGCLDKARVFPNIFAFPATNDGGCSVGSACESYHKLTGKIPQMSLPYLGNPHHNYDNMFGYKTQHIDSKQIATLLVSNNIIGWFQGGSEIGPRALGHRSLLANPCSFEMLEKINCHIKNRKMYRPLCPVILDKFYNDIVEDDPPYNLAKYMLKTVKIRESWRKRIPAVCHVDMTCRPQLLERNDNPQLYEVMFQFYELTGIPVLINTSLNLGGEPIVETVLDCVHLFEKKKQFIKTIVFDGHLALESREREILHIPQFI